MGCDLVIHFSASRGLAFAALYPTAKQYNTAACSEKLGEHPRELQTQICDGTILFTFGS
jgi:hypothetical protein